MVTAFGCFGGDFKIDKGLLLSCNYKVSDILSDLWGLGLAQPAGASGYIGTHKSNLHITFRNGVPIGVFARRLPAKLGCMRSQPRAVGGVHANFARPKSTPERSQFFTRSLL